MGTGFQPVPSPAAIRAPLTNPRKACTISDIPAPHDPSLTYHYCWDVSAIEYFTRVAPNHAILADGSGQPLARKRGKGMIFAPTGFDPRGLTRLMQACRAYGLALIPLPPDGGFPAACREADLVTALQGL